MLIFLFPLIVLIFTIHLSNNKAINIMTAKEKRQAEDQKLIERAISMYHFTHSKQPSENWCLSADRAKFLISYYKENYSIIG